jgi:hypothetical protein
MGCDYSGKHTKNAHKILVEKLFSKWSLGRLGRK